MFGHGIVAFICQQKVFTTKPSRRLLITMLIASVFYAEILGIWDMLLFDVPFDQFQWPPYIDVREQVILDRMLQSKKHIVEANKDMVQGDRFNTKYLSYPSLDQRHCSTFLPSSTDKGFTNVVEQQQQQQQHVESTKNRNQKRRSPMMGMTFKIVVKSKIDNFQYRQNIRQTWGSQTYLTTRRPGVLPVNASVTFLVGDSASDGVRGALKTESDQYGDILWGNFIDSYYNNTRKMMMGLDWLTRRSCPNYELAFFVDDDMFVNAHNAYAEGMKLLQSERASRQTVERERFGTNLIVGYRYKTSPYRNRLHKHYVPRSVYPYAAYPPFVAAGAYFLSRDTVENLHFASRYTEAFILDDVYMGIMAHLLGISPVHCDKLYIQNFNILQRLFIRDLPKHPWNAVIAAHGYRDYQSIRQATEDSIKR